MRFLLQCVAASLCAAQNIGEEPESHLIRRVAGEEDPPGFLDPVFAEQDPPGFLIQAENQVQAVASNLVNVLREASGAIVRNGSVLPGPTSISPLPRRSHSPQPDAQLDLQEEVEAIQHDADDQEEVAVGPSAKVSVADEVDESESSWRMVGDVASQGTNHDSQDNDLAKKTDIKEDSGRRIGDPESSWRLVGDEQSVEPDVVISPKEGDFVRVREAFISNDDRAVHVAAGQIGEVRNVHENGDISLKFDFNKHRLRLHKQYFSKLEAASEYFSKLEAASVDPKNKHQKKTKEENDGPTPRRIPSDIRISSSELDTRSESSESGVETAGDGKNHIMIFGIGILVAVVLLTSVYLCIAPREAPVETVLNAIALTDLDDVQHRDYAVVKTRGKVELEVDEKKKTPVTVNSLLHEQPCVYTRCHVEFKGAKGTSWTTVIDHVEARPFLLSEGCTQILIEVQHIGPADKVNCMLHMGPSNTFQGDLGQLSTSIQTKLKAIPGNKLPHHAWFRVTEWTVEEGDDLIALGLVVRRVGRKEAPSRTALAPGGLSASNADRIRALFSAVSVHRWDAVGNNIVLTCPPVYELEEKPESQ